MARDLFKKERKNVCMRGQRSEGGVGGVGEQGVGQGERSSCEGTHMGAGRRGGIMSRARGEEKGLGAGEDETQRGTGQEEEEGCGGL